MRTMNSPAAGSSFSPGDIINVIATGNTLHNMLRATLSIDDTVVEIRNLNRGDQDSTRQHTWRFFYNIPVTQALGSMEISVRTFNQANSTRGFIADDAKNAFPLAEPIQGAKGTLDGRPGSATSSSKYQPLLAETGYLRTPGGSATITVTIV